jgi:hypothetical protein
LDQDVALDEIFPASVNNLAFEISLNNFAFQGSLRAT